MQPTDPGPHRFISNEKEYTQDIFPNTAESFESPDGGRKWIIRMRKGLKWSDGTPWSTDDIMFWYEDLANNKEFSPQMGEQPIPELLEVWDAYQIILKSFDPEERIEQFRFITDMAADMLWTIGLLSPGGFVVTYVPELKNLPLEFAMWNRGDHGRPWLWFFEE